MTNEPENAEKTMGEAPEKRGFDRNRYTVLKNRPGVAQAVALLADAELRGTLLGALRDHQDIVAAIRTVLKWMHDPAAADKRYFVLRYDCPNGVPADPNARAALAYYAGRVESTNRKFAAELLDELKATDPA